MLPRYRLGWWKSQQQGSLAHLRYDTLGVGINVPIHTVVLTQLTKFDGRKMPPCAAVSSIKSPVAQAARASIPRAVIAEAPEHEIENHKAEVKAAGDPKKLKKIKKKRPPENFVNWNEDTFNKLIDSVPEQLTPRMRITHSMVLAEVEQGGNARARVDQLIEDSLQPAEEKVKLHAPPRCCKRSSTLTWWYTEVDECGEDVPVTMDLPETSRLISRCRRFCWRRLSCSTPKAPRAQKVRPRVHGRGNLWRTRGRCCKRAGAQGAMPPWRR